MNTPTQGNEPAKNPAPNVQSTKPVAAGTVAKADPDNDAKKAEQDKLNDEVERLRKEKDGDISASEQKAIDAAMGDNAEEEVVQPKSSPLFADPLQNTIDEVHKRDGGTKERLEQFVSNYKHPVELITQMVRDVAADTPDEHIVWGASGHILRYGHLRALVMGIDRQR